MSNGKVISPHTLEEPTFTSVESSKILVPQYQLHRKCGHQRQMSEAVPQCENELSDPKRHFVKLNLANYQKTKVKTHLNVVQPEKRRTSSIQMTKNSKILEKNEACENMSISSYEESIDASQKELLNYVGLMRLYCIVEWQSHY